MGEVDRLRFSRGANQLIIMSTDSRIEDAWIPIHSINISSVTQWFT